MYEGSYAAEAESEKDRVGEYMNAEKVWLKRWVVCRKDECHLRNALAQKRVPGATIAQSPPLEFRGALSYNHYFRLWAPGWLFLPSLKQFLTPKGTLWIDFETNFGSRKAIGDSFAGTSL